MSNPVSAFWYDSTMSGAPTLSGEAGKFIGVLDACLINGFGSVTLDSVVVTDSVATATLSTGHGFTDYVVVEIAGATPSGLNGNKRLTRTSSTVFTFDATGISNQTATGTITAKVAPVGWTKPYSGTYKAVYARSDMAATAMVLRVDDTLAQYPVVTMYESMSDVDTGVGSSGDVYATYITKSISEGNGLRSWRLFADSRCFYFFNDTYGDGRWDSAMMFGDIAPYNSTDAYHCLIIGSMNGQNVFLNANGSQNSVFARSYTQVAGAVAGSNYSHRKCTYLGTDGMANPNPATDSIHLWPVECWEGSGAYARGLMPGLWCPLHATSLVDSTIYEKDGAKFMVQKTASPWISARAALNITGPWR